MLLDGMSLAFAWGVPQTETYLSWVSGIGRYPFTVCMTGVKVKWGPPQNGDPGSPFYR